MFPTAEKKTQLKPDSSVRLVRTQSHQKASQRVAQSIIDLQAALGRPPGEKTAHGTADHSRPRPADRLSVSSAARPPTCLLEPHRSQHQMSRLCDDRRLFFLIDPCWFRCSGCKQDTDVSSVAEHEPTKRTNNRLNRSRFHCQSALFLPSDSVNKLLKCYF